MTTYLEALAQTIHRWNKDPIEDEWLFASFREEFVETMSPPQAFDAIGETVDLLLIQSDESTATEILETIVSLARQSDTTEIPPELLAQRPAIAKQFAKFGQYARNKLGELLRIYRLS